MMGHERCRSPDRSQLSGGEKNLWLFGFPGDTDTFHLPGKSHQSPGKCPDKSPWSGEKSCGGQGGKKTNKICG